MLLSWRYLVLFTQSARGALVSGLVSLRAGKLRHGALCLLWSEPRTLPLPPSEVPWLGTCWQWDWSLLLSPTGQGW